MPSFGQLTSEQVSGLYSKTLTRHYDTFGRNVGYSVDGERKQSITYDSATGRIAESDGFRWDYLAGSNLKSKLTYPNEAVVTWSYEPHRDLLTAVTNATYSTYVYTNDLLGRRTSKNDEQYGYNVRDELISADEVSYNYDDIGADGNQTLIKTETGIWSVNYNAENRPIRWTQGDTVITMAFDRMGRRVEMRTQSAASDTLQRFVYDNYLCIQQLRGAENALYHSYIWDPTEPIATRPLVFIPSVGETAYYFHDGNKNVSDLISIESASIHYKYTPFGSYSVFSLSGNPFCFSSEFNDSLLGLTYYNYRHYHEGAGRWVTREPFDEDEASGLYTMLDNSPAYKTDWLGLLFYYYQTLDGNYSSLPNGVRALTQIRQTVVSQCSSTFRLSVIITISVEIKVLTPSHPAWRKRYKRYNLKWGNPRTNEREREAAIAHEKDHVQAVVAEMKVLRKLNTLDGKQYSTMCECKEVESKINEIKKKYFDQLQEILDKQDTYPYNQGGINVYE